MTTENLKESSSPKELKSVFNFTKQTVNGNNSRYVNSWVFEPVFTPETYSGACILRPKFVERDEFVQEQFRYFDNGSMASHWFTSSEYNKTLRQRSQDAHSTSSVAPNVQSFTARLLQKNTKKQKEENGNVLHAEMFKKLMGQDEFEKIEKQFKTGRLRRGQKRSMLSILDIINQ